MKVNLMIKTRFAPSPTGYLHIGGLRTALYNYLFTKQNKGKFILRIEDTDRKRGVEGGALSLLSTLQKTGLKWNEGPMMDKTLKIRGKGRFGPYFQSKRIKIYQKYAEKLVENGRAYYCFCSEERLAKLREEQKAKKLAPKYDGQCRNQAPCPMPHAPCSMLHAPCPPYVIRLKVPKNRPAFAEATAGKEVVFNDLIRGQVRFKTSEIDDQILLKSDGFPTYHLAVVVDDHLMGITHVIRGEEWLPSTPKHILLYRAFGWELPQFAHLPLLLNPDKSKLSKRQGDVSVEDYLNKGYLPEALINYVALLGWHPKDDREIFSLEELVKEFSLDRVRSSGATFDLNKLNWFNCHYIKQKSNKELVELCGKFLPDIDKKQLAKILKIEKERLNNLAEIGEKVKIFLELPDYGRSLLIFKKSSKETTQKGLNLALVALKNLNEPDWQKEKLNQALAKAVGDNNLTNGDVFWPVRVAVSGQEKSPAPEEIMWALGKVESLKRIGEAVQKINSKL